MLVGRQSWSFDRGPVILGAAAVVGPEEGKGPLGQDFDIVHDTMEIGEKTWEKAEKKLMLDAADEAVRKSGVDRDFINFYVGGDLLNQIISNSFAARTLGIPYFGIFGACSTSMEGLALASMMVHKGAARHVLAGTCSHNCTAEKQFRYPTEYGSQKPPSAQYTVTGAGAAVIGTEGDGPRVVRATIGRIVDLGIKDPFNMGAAMAPAAVDTIMTHCRDFGITPGHYDLIVTGDLAAVGYDIARELFARHHFPIGETDYRDCGLMIFDRERQSVQAGGSGCGCSATVTYGPLLRRLQAGELKRILVVATGALLSPISFQQGESIPGIAHAVAIESGRG
ncbi:stage V sporulation protein AD [Gorillibacterium sp. sgz5001074]|uniref:stage V sporulation protein AD n=1 Tax=Gorillibacterium sp. sgz5001074 TaxID=3446695 RepID=UPI003F674115